jgi:hypothetical protein
VRDILVLLVVLGAVEVGVRHLGEVRAAFYLGTPAVGLTSVDVEV